MHSTILSVLAFYLWMICMSQCGKSSGTCDYTIYLLLLLLSDKNGAKNPLLLLCKSVNIKSKQ